MLDIFIDKQLLRPNGLNMRACYNLIVHFVRIYIGIIKLFLWGHGYKLTPEQEVQSRYVVDWTSRFFATVLEKPLDALVAQQLLKKYPPVGRTLDVGCGAGRMGLALFEKYRPMIRLDGLDDETELESNIRQGNQRIIYELFIKASFDKTGLADNSYNYIFSNNAIQVSADMKQTLKELRRVLKPGGVLIFNVSTPAYYDGIGKREGWLPQFYEVKAMREIISSLGLELVELITYNGGKYSRVMFTDFFSAYQSLWNYAKDPNGQTCGGLYQILYALYEKMCGLLMNAYARASSDLDVDDGVKLYVVAVKSQGD